MKKTAVDVLIIGAGLSGIGAAIHLRKHCPEKSVALLEARDAIGGTWDLFRYPGIRSDSDMYTLGYKFKPWVNDKAIADGGDILSYIREAAREYDVDSKVRFGHKVINVDWNSRTARWTILAEHDGKQLMFESRFIFCCAGYYKYENGYTPEFAGRDQFKGDIVHPQLWPQDLDYRGKNVVVIGSGATAVTLVPAMAKDAAHVTMLQRSPSYVASVPEKDLISNNLRKVLPEKLVYSMARTRNVLLGSGFYQLTQRYPTQMKKLLMGMVEKRLGGATDMSHFDPRYNPWEQRLCAVPDGDMFARIREGKASVVTDHIERFTEQGILLKSGKELKADIIITATGLEVQMVGGMTVSLDGQQLDPATKLYYRGAMIEDVPNFAMVFGYTNSSWTLKADLISEYMCRVIKQMDRQGKQVCTPRNHDPDMPREPFLNLSSGYVQRVIDRLPRQGRDKPWRLYQNYFLDYVALRLKPVADGALVFSNPISHVYDFGGESVKPQAEAG